MNICISKKIAVISITAVIFYASQAFGEVIVLKSGKAIDAKITERADDHVTIDFFGVPIKYKINEIDSIDGVKIAYKRNDSPAQSYIQQSRPPAVIADKPQAPVKAAPAVKQSSNNAAPLYLKAISLLRKTSNEAYDDNNLDNIIRYGWKGDARTLDKILDDNGDAIKAFVKGSGMESCDFSASDAMAPQTEIGIPDFESMLALARFTALDARRLLYEARDDAAAERIAAILRFAGHLASQRNFALAANAASLSTQDLVFPITKEMLEQNILGLDSLGRLSGALNFLKSSRRGLQEAFRLENEASKTAVSAIPETLSDEKFRAKAENYFKTLSSEYNKFADEICESAVESFEANKPYTINAKMKGLPREIDPMRINWEDKAKENEPEKMAKKLCGASPDYGTAITQYYIQSVRADLMKIAIAFRTYEKKEGYFPKGLAALTPAYFDSVPEDPFDGFKPVKYEYTSGRAAIFSNGFAGSRIAIYLDEGAHANPAPSQSGA